MSIRPTTIVFLATIGECLDRFVGLVARDLSRQGLRTVAVAARGTLTPTLSRDFDAVYGITPFRRSSLRGLARAGQDLLRIVRQEQADLLHLHTPFAVALGRAVARATRTPHLAVVHGTLFGTATNAGRLFSAVEVSSARLTPTYITLNADDCDSYRRLAPRSETYLAPCGGLGIDLARVAARAGDPAGAGHAVLSDRPPRVLIMGRLTPDKNFDLAVSAWRLVRRTRPDVRLRIVGSTFPGEPAWTPPTDEGIEVVGWTPQPGEEHANADVLVSTSLREGFPMTIAEALCHGVPVVAVDNRGTRAIRAVADDAVALVPAQATAVCSAILTQLDAGPVRLPPTVTHSWSRANVVRYHVERTLDAIGR